MCFIIPFFFRFFYQLIMLIATVISLTRWRTKEKAISICAVSFVFSCFRLLLHFFFILVRFVYFFLWSKRKIFISVLKFLSIACRERECHLTYSTYVLLHKILEFWHTYTHQLIYPHSEQSKHEAKQKKKSTNSVEVTKVFS